MAFTSSHGDSFGDGIADRYPDIPSSPLSEVPSDFEIESDAERLSPIKVNPDVGQLAKGAAADQKSAVQNPAVKKPAVKKTAVKKPAVKSGAIVELSRGDQEHQEPSEKTASDGEHTLEASVNAKFPIEIEPDKPQPNVSIMDRAYSSDTPTIPKKRASRINSAKQQLPQEEAMLASPKKITPAKRQIPDAPEGSGRPSRRKISSTCLRDEHDEHKQSPRPEKSPSVRKRQPIRANWSATYLLENAKSKLATIDMAKLLSHERAWTELSREQQLQLVTMLPDASLPSLPEEVPLPNVLKEYVKSNNSFLADIRLFQEDLSAGRYEPQWQKDAKVAMERRARGDFDDWKEKNREAFWGQKQKVQWAALAGESSQHSLETLVAAGTFEVGDVWTLSRTLGHRSNAIRVEKEAKITAISTANLLTFTFPPGWHKFSAPANGEDITITGVDGPHPLSIAILKEDGRITSRGGNAWKEFRCFRRNQDIGSLWDVREQYDRASRRQN